MKFGEAVDNNTQMDETLKNLEKLLMYQFGDDGEIVEEFVTFLFKWADRKSEKKNCILILGPPNSGKSYFTRALKCSLLTYGQVATMTRHHQFPLNNCINKRVLHWDEPNFEPIMAETLKLIFSGDEVSTNIKYQDYSTLFRTPIICTANCDPFPKDEAFFTRIQQYNWQTAPFLKDWKKQLHPMGIYKLYDKYNLLTLSADETEHSDFEAVHNNTSATDTD